MYKGSKRSGENFDSFFRREKLSLPPLPHKVGRDSFALFLLAEREHPHQVWLQQGILLICSVFNQIPELLHLNLDYDLVDVSAKDTFL